MPGGSSGVPGGACPHTPPVRRTAPIAQMTSQRPGAHGRLFMELPRPYHPPEDRHAVTKVHNEERLSPIRAALSARDDAHIGRERISLLHQLAELVYHSYSNYNSCETEARFPMRSQEIPAEISELVTKVTDTEERDERRRYLDRLCEAMRTDPALMKPFAKKYLLHFPDEFELSVALSVLSRTDELDATITPILIRFVSRSKVTIHYKRRGLFLLSRLADLTPVNVYQNIMSQPDIDMRISMANDLLIHIHQVTNVKKAFRLIKLCLQLGSSQDSDIRESLLDAFITFAHAYSRARGIIYEYALNELIKPHHKMLLFLGLSIADPEKAKAYSDNILPLADTSRIANWYLRKYEVIKE
jgi:hypothetical protein